ncbi:hypothetical protein [Spiroplasma endosymbiont of Virgichneumon dumeticola]|uniref:hypothetical protein n=1 Tax=Spiroplasma endosymbiont of Virgichneumon dumeticola TaxID=3139323 RepID=UPI0035C93FFB
MNTEKNNVKIHEIKKDKFIDKIYNNTFFLITISIVSVVVLLVVIALLVASFTVWN